MTAQQFMAGFSSAGRINAPELQVGDSYLANRKIGGVWVKVRLTWDGKEWR
jgi:hypothetical protein